MPIFAKIDFRGLQYHPEVLVELKTRSTICGTHVQTILNHKDLTGSAVGVREGQNTEQYGAIFVKIDFWGLKYPPQVLVELKTCSTICGTHVHTILNQKNLTGSTVGVGEGQNTEQYWAIWGNFLPYFDLPTHPLPTRSNYYGSKWFVHVPRI